MLAGRCVPLELTALQGLWLHSTCLSTGRRRCSHTNTLQQERSAHQVVGAYCGKHLGACRSNPTYQEAQAWTLKSSTAVAPWAKSTSRRRMWKRLAHGLVTCGSWELEFGDDKPRSHPEILRSGFTRIPEVLKRSASIPATVRRIPVYYSTLC